MKKKKLSRKLVLNKFSISELNSKNLNNLKGGGPTCDCTLSCPPTGSYNECCHSVYDSCIECGPSVDTFCC